MKLLSLIADVLLVGQGLVDPDLPGLLDGAMDRLAGPGQVEAQVADGASIAWIWDHAAELPPPDPRARIAQGGLDALILTEAQPIAGQMRAGSAVPALARFASAARAVDPDTRVYLYETWPALTGTAAEWRAAIATDLALWQALADQAGAEAQVEITLIPGGQAMAALSLAIEQGEGPEGLGLGDFLADGQHLTGRGLAFVALVQAAVLSGRSPEGLPARLERSWKSRDSVLSEAQALVLQRLAWQVANGPAGLGQAQAAAQAVTPAGAGKAIAAHQRRLETMASDLAKGLTPITNPALGLGLAGVNDWSVQLPFLDLMKTARPWVGHLPGQWGGWEHDDLWREGYLDANGWPLRMPPELSAISTLVLTDLPPDTAGAAGRYLMRWKGRGDLAVEGRARDVLRGSDGQSLTFDFTPGEGMVLITLRAIDESDPIRDISIVREDRVVRHEAGAIFNPDFLARLRGARVLRFMDWQATNNSPLIHARSRPRPDDYTWARMGVPVEVQVALANTLAANPWFTIPHKAEDALVREMAEVAERDLDPGLTAHVEYSNEVWNWQFTQARWAEERGRARWGQDGTWLQYYGLRATEVARIWREVFAIDPDRLRTVIATQTGAPGAEVQILEAPLVQAGGQPPPYTAFDAYAVTGYFAALLGSEVKAPMVRRWLAEARAADPFHPFAAALPRAAAELASGAESGSPEDTLDHLLTEVLPYHAAVAGRYGLELMMYEGGTHVVGMGPIVDDPEMTEFFKALNYSPEMGALYGRLIAGWAKVSGTPFMAFVDIYAPNKWGSWGALRHLGDDNPRWQALARGCPEC